jgi:hypothetical protein
LSFVSVRRLHIAVCLTRTTRALWQVLECGHGPQSHGEAHAGFCTKRSVTQIQNMTYFLFKRNFSSSRSMCRRKATFCYIILSLITIILWARALWAWWPFPSSLRVVGMFFSTLGECGPSLISSLSPTKPKDGWSRKASFVTSPDH